MSHNAPDALTHRLEDYEAAARPMTASDMQLLHELAVSVFWPHRPQDLAALFGLGDGILACDEIGRAMGSGMVFRMGDDFATIGMMMTTPRLQSGGIGRWLLGQMAAACTGRDLRLFATRQSYRLYESAGFIPVGTVHQHQGIARAISLPETPHGLTLRAMMQQDLDALVQLDRQAYGADRRRVLEALLRKSDGMVALRGDVIVGAALMRNFGRGKVIGPVIAEDDAMAMALTAPLIRQQEGQFLRLDTPSEDSAFNAFLAAAWLSDYDTVTQMRRGPKRGGEQAARVFGLAAQALG